MTTTGFQLWTDVCAVPRDDITTPLLQYVELTLIPIPRAVLLPLTERHPALANALGARAVSSDAETRAAAATAATFFLIFDMFCAIFLVADRPNTAVKVLAENLEVRPAHAIGRVVPSHRLTKPMLCVGVGCANEFHEETLAFLDRWAGCCGCGVACG